MFSIPQDYEWLAPWASIEDEGLHICLGRAFPDACNESVAERLVEELRREMPDGHVLCKLGLQVVAYCEADPNEFLFVTDDPAKPVACVHLTWQEETDPTWPYTRVYGSLAEWTEQMEREHAGLGG
jgi:hypothetical protein